MAGGVGDGAHPEIEASVEQHGGDATKAIEKCLGDPAPEEGHADRQPTHQHRRRAERGSQLDQASLEPEFSGHPRKSYSVNVTTPQLAIDEFPMITG